MEMALVSFRMFLAGLASLAFLAAPAVALDECPQDRRVHLAGCVDLDTVMAGDLQFSGAWIGAMAQGERTAQARLTILNRGKTADRLLGASSLAARLVDVPAEGGVAIEPGETLDFRPGGLELRLTDVDGRLRSGAEIEITLSFEQAGPVVLSFPVRDDPSATAAH